MCLPSDLDFTSPLSSQPSQSAKTYSAANGLHASSSDPKEETAGRSKHAAIAHKFANKSRGVEAAPQGALGNEGGRVQDVRVHVMSGRDERSQRMAVAQRQ